MTSAQPAQPGLPGLFLAQKVSKLPGDYALDVVLSTCHQQQLATLSLPA